MADDDREAILARRKQFIALALAGGATVGAAAIGAGAYAVLTPCLSPAPIDAPVANTPDAPLPIEPDAGAAPMDAGAPPTVMVPREPPRAEAPAEGNDDESPTRVTPARPEAAAVPCLSVVRPRPSDRETPPPRRPRVTE